MFYPVRILNPELKLKKTISSEELSNIHWKKFNFPEDKKQNNHRRYKLSLKERLVLLDRIRKPEVQNNN